MNFLGITKQKQEDQENEEKYYKDQRCKMKFLQESNLDDMINTRENIKLEVEMNEKPDMREKMLGERFKFISEFIANNNFNKVPNKAEDFYDPKMIPLTPEEGNFSIE